MGWQDHDKKKKQLELDEADRAWFADRMKALVAELETLKSARQLTFVRTCLTDAIACHARITPGNDSGDDTGF